MDPVGRSELGNFGGFGDAPGAIASNGVDQLFVSSRSEGLMVFDLLERRVLRGAGNAIPVPDNAGVTVDSHQRIYALESGDCQVGTPGALHLLRPGFSEIRSLPVGRCAAAVLVTEIPPLAP